jgi:Right handed beta helix region
MARSRLSILSVLLVSACGDTSSNVADAGVRVDSGAMDGAIDAAPGKSDMGPTCDDPCGAPPATGKLHYVSPTGSDTTGDGSQANPWATPAGADAALTIDPAGTVVCVAPGMYRGGDFNKSGAAAGRLRFVSTERWGAKITSQWTIWGAYVDVIGFDFDFQGSGWDGIAVESGDAVNVINNRLRNICNDSCCSAGAIDADSRGGIVSGNVIDNIGPPDVAGCNQTHGIYASKPDMIVQNNIISRATGWGIHAHGFDCHIVISNNTVFNNGHGGIITGEENQSDVPDCPIDDYNTITNNIVVDNGSYGGVDFYCQVGGNNLVSNNLIFGNAGDDYQQSSTCGSPDMTTQVFNKFADSGTDVTFVDYRADGSGDYHLKANSAAIGHGTESCAPGTSGPCAPTTDAECRARASGNDIGAYQH